MARRKDLTPAMEAFSAAKNIVVPKKAPPPYGGGQKKWPARPGFPSPLRDQFATACTGGTAVFGMGTGRSLRRIAPAKLERPGAHGTRTGSQTLTTPEEEALDRLVRPRSTRCRASTDRLSTRWSLGGLPLLPEGGYLILGPVSRLDAVSASPSRT